VIEHLNRSAFADGAGALPVSGTFRPAVQGERGETPLFIDDEYRQWPDTGSATAAERIDRLFRSRDPNGQSELDEILGAIAPDVTESWPARDGVL